MGEIDTAITTNATGPKKVAADGVVAEQHPLPEQIEAAKFAASQTNKSRSGFPLRRILARPPGAEPES